MASIQVYDQTSKRTGRKERRYRAFYRDAAGRQVAKVFKVRRDAQHWLDERTHERLTGTLPDRRAGRMTFRALWEEVHAHPDYSYAPATIALHDHVWKYLEPLADRPIGDITSAVLNRVLAGIGRPVMREKARLVASTVFGFAVTAGRIGTNPAKKQARPRTRAARRRTGPSNQRRLSGHELQALVDAVPERYRVLVRVMAHVGLRPGEAYALTVGQVGTVLTIDRAAAAEGETKTGETREIPLPNTVHNLLQDHMAKFADPTDRAVLVFTNTNGNPVEHGAFRHLLGRACRRAGIEPVTPNDLRHTAAAFAVDAGLNVYAVQRMLGHSKPSITLDIYGYLWDDSLERGMEQLDEALRSAFSGSER